jgi:hypothetical protein
MSTLYAATIARFNLDSIWKWAVSSAQSTGLKTRPNSGISADTITWQINRHVLTRLDVVAGNRKGLKVIQ